MKNEALAAVVAVIATVGYAGYAQQTHGKAVDTFTKTVASQNSVLSSTIERLGTRMNCSEAVNAVRKYDAKIVLDTGMRALSEANDLWWEGYQNKDEGLQKSARIQQNVAETRVAAAKAVLAKPVWVNTTAVTQQLAQACH